MGYASLARWPRLLIIGALALIAALPLPLAAVPPATQRVPAPPAQPVPPPIDPGDENWSAGFRYPGLNGKVETILAAPNGDIYAGGTFSQADDERSVGVARWDGARWHGLGAGIDGGGLDGACCFEVNALALGPDGSLYAGGRFAKAGGVTVNHIARWDGSQWHALAGGMSRQNSSDVAVSAIAVDQQGSVYVAGRFTLAGGVAVDHIARWDGSQWHAFGGLSGGALELAIGPDNDLYASGQFTPASGVTGGIGRWDGAQWHALGAGPGSLVAITQLDFDQAGMLYAGGSFANANSGVAQNIARWDGSQWHTLGAGLPYSVSAMAAGPNGAVYAGMNAQIMRWDGQAWAPLPGTLNGYAHDLETAADGALYAAADVSPLTDKPLYIARWEGEWRELSMLSGEGVGGPIRDMLAAPDGSIYAAGLFWHAGSVKASGIARWDGSSWHTLGSGLHGTVMALAIGPDGAIYAGGDFRIGAGDFALQVARWNGVQWQSLGGGLMDRNAGSISALAVGTDGSVYVGGYVGNAAFSGIGRWNGASWQSVGAGLGDIENGTVADLLIAGDGSLYAGGHFERVNGADIQASAARWDGANWQAIDGAAGAEDWPALNALAFNAGSLYAAGDDFTPEAPGAGVARWDGSQWQSIPGSSLGGDIQFLADLAFDQTGNLFIGGVFAQVGSELATNIARWDGAQWHALGSGINGQVANLVVDGSGRLFASGSFSMAGSTGAGRIARWTAGDGRCGLTPAVPAVFYAQNQPVAVTVRTPGTLACLSVQRVDASHPLTPAALKTGAHWAIHGTDQAGAPATGTVFDLSLPLPADSGNDDQACWLGVAWNCAADSISTSAVTVTDATYFGIWTRADTAAPGATWELAELAVDTSALASSQILTYTLVVGTNFGGHYSATLDLHPALTLLAAPEMEAAGDSLSATGVVSPGAMHSYTITAAVSPSFSGTISQTALISGGAQDRTLNAPPVVLNRTFLLHLPLIKR